MAMIGPYSEKELKEKLRGVSMDEMKAFNERRMRTYRKGYIASFILGIACVPLYWAWRPLIYISAILGFIVLMVTSFKRKQWMNLYANFYYYKQVKTKKDEERALAQDKEKASLRNTRRKFKKEKK